MGHKKREIQYDYLRTAAVFAIIMVHSIPAEPLNSRQWLFSAAIMPVLLSFVGIYFMLSGLFLLQAGTEDILEFYRNRFQGIIVPFVFYSGIYYWYYKIYLGAERQGGIDHLKAFGNGLLTGTIPMASHMWFMYVIMALYLCTPFLARMMKAMSDRDLKIFLSLMLIVQGILTYLPALGLEVGDSLNYMVFKGWLIYFVLGYACKRLYGGRPYLPFALIGIAGFSVTLLQKCFTPSFVPGIHDMAYTMIAMSVSIFMFFGKVGRLKIPVFIKAAGFISRYSYSVYLIHYLVLSQFAGILVEKTSLRHYYLPQIIGKAGLTFIISLIAAWILDETIVKILKKGFSAAGNRKKG